MSTPSKEQLVYLSIYDLQWSSLWPRKLVWILGLGVFHSGVEVYGSEFAFYGHQTHAPEVTQSEPKCDEHMNRMCKYKTSILIGHTELSKFQVLQAVSEISKDWQGPSYHLFTKNCNDFSDNLCQILCKKSIPDWVNRLAKFAASVPFLDTIVPTTWIQPRVHSQKPIQKESIKVKCPDDSDSEGGSEQWLVEAQCCCTSSKYGNHQNLKKSSVEKNLRAKDISTRSVSRASVTANRIKDNDSSDGDGDGNGDLILVKSPLRISSSETSRSPSPNILSPRQISNSKSRRQCRIKGSSQGRMLKPHKSRTSRSSRRRTQSKSRRSRSSRSRNQTQSRSRRSRNSQCRSQTQSRGRRSRNSRSRSRTRNKSRSRSRTSSRQETNRISSRATRTSYRQSRNRSKARGTSRTQSRGRTDRSKSRKRPASRTRTNSRRCKLRNVSRSHSRNQHNRKVKPKSRQRRK